MSDRSAGQLLLVQRIAWFVALWAASVASLGLVALALRWALRS